MPSPAILKLETFYRHEVRLTPREMLILRAGLEAICNNGDEDLDASFDELDRLDRMLQPKPSKEER